jgi:hypothetical protein
MQGALRAMLEQRFGLASHADVRSPEGDPQDTARNFELPSFSCQLTKANMIIMKINL